MRVRLTRRHGPKDRRTLARAWGGETRTELLLTAAARARYVVDVSARFPFPSFPRGWFVVGFSPDLAPGDVKTVHYFGEDIVLFRTASGVLSALDKTCPHLGAHLGGGKVEGECLRCPFHEWAFDGSGKCVDIPYAPKIPPKAAVKTWHVLEQNGVIFAWYCPRGTEPDWRPPPLEEEGWTPNQVVRWELASHPQEIAENTVDCSHLKPVHHIDQCEVKSVEQKDHYMHVLLQMVASGAPVEMPDEVHDVELDVTLYGIGNIVSTTRVLNAELRTRQRIYPTVVDVDRVAIFGVNNTAVMADPDYTRDIDNLFYKAFLTDFPRDFPIWEKKVWLDKPLLAGGDGPIGRYRRWCRQFYDYPEATRPAEAAATASQPQTVVARLTRWIRDLSQRPVYQQQPQEEEVDTHGPGKQREQRAEAPVARFPSVDAYFSTLAARFDRDAAGDLEAVFQWVLTGEAERAHFVEIRGGQAQVADGVHPAPTLTIEMTSADYLAMINGELNGARAFATGRGKLRGPVRLAMKMQRLFPLERAV